MTKKVNRFGEQLVRKLPFYIYIHCTIIECLLASRRKVVCVCVCVSYCVFKLSQQISGRERSTCHDSAVREALLFDRT
jgi:hypothetical protein